MFLDLADKWKKKKELRSVGKVYTNVEYKNNLRGLGI